MPEDEQRYGGRVAKLLTREDYETAYRRRESHISPWLYLRENRIEEGLELFRNHDPKFPPQMLGLGQALMWIGQYEPAARIFEQSIGMPEKHPLRSETSYAFLGAARWCLQDYSSAFRRWRDGIDAPYATSGICTETPLLLFVGSILHPELYNRTEPEEILRKKLSDPQAGTRTEHWPACLGKLVLGTIPKEAMSAWWVRTTHLYEVVFERNRQWLTEFYEAVLDLGCGALTLADFRRLMRQRTDESAFADWELTHWEHLRRRAEFYIARCEGSQATD